MTNWLVCALEKWRNMSSPPLPLANSGRVSGGVVGAAVLVQSSARKVREWAGLSTARLSPTESNHLSSITSPPGFYLTGDNIFCLSLTLLPPLCCSLVKFFFFFHFLWPSVCADARSATRLVQQQMANGPSPGYFTAGWRIRPLCMVPYFHFSNFARVGGGVWEGTGGGRVTQLETGSGKTRRHKWKSRPRWYNHFVQHEHFCKHVW